MDAKEKELTYREVGLRIAALTEGEYDEVALMATVVCELHHAFDYFHWTGFYRRVEESLLKVGPYQGGHGCLSIAFDRGVCGACASSGETQLVEDVHSLPYHIACSATTVSEIVVPVFNGDGKLIAVFDVDSNESSAFDQVDKVNIEKVCEIFNRL